MTVDGFSFHPDNRVEVFRSHVRFLATGAFVAMFLTIRLATTVFAAETYRVYLATSDGVMLTRIDTDTGTLSEPIKASDHRLTWFALRHDSRFLCGGSTRSPADGDVDGGVSTFTMNRDGTLKFLDERSSEGKTPCYVDIDCTGTIMLVANFRYDNYASRGSLVAFTANEDGSLGRRLARSEHPGKGGTDSDRQQASHPHSVVISPDNKYAAVGDLGIDKIFIYRLDEKRGIEPLCSVAGQPGQQPRHLAWHPNSRWLYCMNEAAKTVSFLEFDRRRTEVKFVQHIDRVRQSASSAGADLKIHPSGRFLYGTNRGADTIVAFRIDASTGKLTSLGEIAAGGSNTRSIALSPDGRWLIAANQGNGLVKVFRIDAKGGTLTDTGNHLKTASPACVQIAAP